MLLSFLWGAAGTTDHLPARLARAVHLLATPTPRVCRPWLPRGGTGYAWLRPLQRLCAPRGLCPAAGGGRYGRAHRYARRRESDLGRPRLGFAGGLVDRPAPSRPLPWRRKSMRALYPQGVHG